MSERKQERKRRGTSEPRFAADGSAPALSGGASGLRPPEPDEMLQAVLELSRLVTVEMHADEVVHTYVERFSRLFPTRLCCVRLLDAQGGELSMVYATGRLRPERRDRIELS